MKVLCAHIVFEASRGREELSLRKPSSVTVHKSWKLLTDTAVITLPRNVIDFDNQKVKEVFAPGDPVTISLGYDGEYYDEFIGFVSRVSADIPIKIYCEDSMWKLKQLPVNISLRQPTLEELLFEIAPEYEVDALNVNLGASRYANTTVTKVLEDLKSKYSLFSYMRGETLVCGKVYADDTDTEPVNVHLEKNVVSNTLEYRNADDQFIKIKAVSTKPNGDKITVEVGDDQGETRQLTYYNIEQESELRKIAEEDLKKYKVDGYRGTITTFGEPVIEHGFKVDLTSDLYPDRDGLYYVEAVRVTFGQGFRYRRVLTLGDKAV